MKEKFMPVENVFDEGKIVWENICLRNIFLVKEKFLFVENVLNLCKTVFIKEAKKLSKNLNCLPFCSRQNYSHSEACKTTIKLNSVIQQIKMMFIIYLMMYMNIYWWYGICKLKNTSRIFSCLYSSRLINNCLYFLL